MTTVVNIATVYDSLASIVGDIADGVMTKADGQKKLQALAKKCQDDGIPFIVPDELLGSLTKASPNPNIKEDEFDSYDEESSSEFFEEDDND